VIRILLRELTTMYQDICRRKGAIERPYEWKLSDFGGGFGLVDWICRASLCSRSGPRPSSPPRSKARRCWEKFDSRTVGFGDTDTPSYFRLKALKACLKVRRHSNFRRILTHLVHHMTLHLWAQKNHHYDSNAIVETFSTRTMFLKRTETHDER
jgi:hypothetical protein